MSKRDGGGSDEKKGKPSKRRSKKIKLVTIIKRRNQRKMEAKEEIQSEISREVTLTPPPTHIPFAGLVCVFTLILPWPYPTVTALPSTCLPACALAQGQTRQGKEGGREREGTRKEGGFLQPRKQNSEKCVWGGNTERSGGGG